MKYLASSLLLAATAAAAPTLSKRNDERSPIASVFAQTFPNFYGTSPEDVATYIAKSEKATQERNDKAEAWQRSASEAADEAAWALTASKRALYIRRASGEDQDFWIAEYEKANDAARRAAKLRREAAAHLDAASEAQNKLVDLLKTRASEDEISSAETSSSTAQTLATESQAAANAAAEEASESYAVVAYVLKARIDAEEDLEEATKRDQSNAEMAMGLERRTKREAYFATKQAKEREVIHQRALKLQAEFGE